jgi:hypothetical protein
MMLTTGKPARQPRAFDRHGALLLCVAMSAFAGNAAISYQGSKDTDKKQAADSPIGTWRGQSICVVRPSGCNDEESLYRVSASAQAKDHVHLDGSKIVDGKEVNMGSSDCSHNAQTHTLDCPLPNGNAQQYKIEGNVMTGTMTLRDGTLWRKISLRRVEP